MSRIYKDAAIRGKFIGGWKLNLGNEQKKQNWYFFEVQEVFVVVAFHRVSQ
jgi:hypothetical protein